MFYSFVMTACSIIIPVFNNWKLTSQCLDSILKFSGAYPDPVEIIVIDDDSEDGTAFEMMKYTSSYSNIKYYKNDVNSGFSRSCNYGSRLAQGECLVFLNNDTRVTEGWLEHLTATIKKDRDIWIAGAKCLYPDQTIQHAGVAFPEHYRYNLRHIYAGMPANFPLANYEKDYQCVTGACFIIRKEDFESLGGFDERYLNGFEDVDLCLRVGQLGKRIVYQPLCKIIHYESKSDGRFDSASVNKELLIERWTASIIPDELGHFRNDIKKSVSDGNMQLVCDYKPNHIFIPVPQTEEGTYLLLAGELKAKSRGKLYLKYMTGKEPYYNEQKSFTKRIHEGRNIFYFTLPAGYLFGKLALEFANFRGRQVIDKLALYAVNGTITPDAPKIAIVYNGLNASFTGPFFPDSLTGGEKLPFPIKLLVITNTSNTTFSLPDMEMENLEVTIMEGNPLTLPSLLNDFIENSGCKYCLCFSGNAAATLTDLTRYMELMETFPGLGVIYESTAGLLPGDISSFHTLSKNWRVSLRNARDIPIFFRIDAWHDSGRFSTEFPYYFKLDLCLSILSSENWKNIQLAGSGTLPVRAQEPYPSEIKPELENIRSLLFAKHARYLINQWALFTRSKVKMLETPSDQLRSNKSNPHATVIGSLRMHGYYFLKRFFNI